LADDSVLRRLGLRADQQALPLQIHLPQPCAGSIRIRA
jgi:hypothetical protein